MGIAMQKLICLILRRTIAFILFSISFSAIAATGNTVTITHTQGHTTIPAHPQRVIIFDPVVLDIADALGIGVIGVPQNDAPYPDYLAKYKNRRYSNVGTLFEPDYEALNQLKPDLIIAGGRVFDAYDKLSLIAPVIALDLDTHHLSDSLKQRTMLLADLFGKRQHAEKLLADFNSHLENFRKKNVTGESAMVLLISGGKISEYSPGSRFGFVFDLLGFKPALNHEPLSGNHGNVVTSELIMSANPDWLFIIDRDGAIGNNHNLSAKQVLDNPLIRRTTAWRRQHIIYLDSRALYIAGGIQAYLRALMQIDQAVTVDDNESAAK
uniref:Iron complex transport system substrate-binding protein n=1 Tax=Serratia marcescens TaxID=615 RepID=A0A1C3HI43_SERMA|nr:Iron complex transport system substrate-binding protein [Serratia marcescens]